MKTRTEPRAQIAKGVDQRHVIDVCGRFARKTSDPAVRMVLDDIMVQAIKTSEPAELARLERQLRTIKPRVRASFTSKEPQESNDHF